MFKYQERQEVLEPFLTGAEGYPMSDTRCLRLRLFEVGNESNFYLCLPN